MNSQPFGFFYCSIMLCVKKNSCSRLSYSRIPRHWFTVCYILLCFCCCFRFCCPSFSSCRCFWRVNEEKRFGEMESRRAEPRALVLLTKHVCGRGRVRCTRGN
ncbi:hypothetical protein ES332_A11G188900v1 [Gossypium tomentosum]|uniref:Uncharacterized protein n=1 Tax=Gossypium tomentosum TaxID=34277 RepID=A0A5D2NC67_GOSTO|nr:hypothetical protein ES332_A11G188900v1 [Gossypium tomentosum]